jgi:hypothetical protein
MFPTQGTVPKFTEQQNINLPPVIPYKVTVMSTSTLYGVRYKLTTLGTSSQNGVQAHNTEYTEENKFVVRGTV